MKKGTIFCITGCCMSFAALIYAISRNKKSGLKTKPIMSMGVTENDEDDFLEDIFEDDVESESVTKITSEEVGRVFVVDPEYSCGGRAIIRYDGKSYDVKFPRSGELIKERLVEGSRVKVDIKYTFYNSYATREIVAVDGMPCIACSVMDTSSDNLEELL